MPVELDKDGNNYIFNGQVLIGGKVDDSYTITINPDWAPLGVIGASESLEKRIEKLERLVQVLANALGVNEEFLSSVAV